MILGTTNGYEKLQADKAKHSNLHVTGNLYGI